MNTNIDDPSLMPDEELLEFLLLTDKYDAATRENKIISNIYATIIIIPISILILVFTGKEHLERVGIILNFLAAFMIGPELIGEQNLRKASVALQKHLPKYMKVFWFSTRFSWLRNFMILSSLTLLIFYGFALNSENVQEQLLPGYIITSAPFIVAYSTIMMVLLMFTYFAGLIIRGALTDLALNGSFRSVLALWGVILLGKWKELITPRWSWERW